MAKPVDQTKHLADIVGEWGKWQFQLVSYVFMLTAVSAFINIGYSFHAKTVDYWCHDVPHNYTNITEEMKCHSFVNPTERCTQWHYNRTQFYKSIIIEFDLVCDRSYYASLTQSMFMMGYVIAGIIVSYCSDKYGRKPVALICYTIEVLGLISCTFSYNIYQYMISRMFVGLAHSGGGWSIFTILLECCGPKHRSDIVLLTGIGWVVGYMILPGIAYLIQDFRYLTFISTIPMMLMLVWLYFMHESPRWQLANGQLDKAEVNIAKALKMNRKSTDNLRQQINQIADTIRKSESKNGGKRINLLDLFKTPNIRKYTFILWYQNMVNALIYYGLSFNMVDFGGNFYITFLLSGLVELPSQLLTPLLLRFIGRRKLFALFMLIVSVSCIAVIPATSSWLKVLLALISKFAISTSWSIVAIHGNEIYPTVIRVTGNGVASVVTRIGSISAPFMGNLTLKTSLAFVMIIYAILSTVGAILGLYLPETKDREVPDTIEDAENLGKTISKHTKNNIT